MMTRRALPNGCRSAAGLLLLTLLPAACARGQHDVAPPPRTAATPVRDTLADPTLVPAGYGTLRQDDIAIRLDIRQLQVKAIPLEESIIRTLSPDSYRAMHDLVESRRARVEQVAQRRGLQSYRLWYVSYYALQPDVPYSPQEVVLVNNGREYRPLEVLPLSANFGSPRLRQREMQAAIYLFDGAMDLQQAITVQVEAERSDAWSQVVQRVERERALIRSRVAKQPAAPR